MGRLSRRGFVQLSGAGLLAAPLLAEACQAPAPPVSSTSTSSAGATAQTSKTSLFPTYVPVGNGPKPDYPSIGPLYEDGFDNYPPNPAPAISTPPGKGGRVDITTIALFPPPTPYDQNPAWQAVNKQLNADVQFNILPSGDYAVRMATLMAGNDVPDMIFFWNAPGATSAIGALNGAPQFIESACADLTPYLAGDAAKDYPYLAAIPTSAWTNSGAVYNGKVLMVPLHRHPLGFPFYKNDNIYDTEIGKDYTPKDAADFKRVMQALTRPQEDRYAIAQTNIAIYYAALFGAPNGWRLESSGKLTHMWETQEFKDGLAFLNDLWNAGVFHPNTLTYTSIDASRGDYAAGKFVIWLDQFGNGWQLFWRKGLQSSGYNFNIIPPFSAHAGQKPQFFLTGGYLGATSLKKASPDRIKELLGILNYLAAPFGSAEDLLLTSGVNGVDYTLDPKGNPVLTPQGNPDANFTPWKYVTQHPAVIYTPDIPNYASTLSNAEHTLIPFGVRDPSVGLVSHTQITKGAALAQPVTDGTTDIIAGRRPLSDWDGLIHDYFANGGEQIRNEFMQAIQSAR